jgi:hypothetical protein
MRQYGGKAEEPFTYESADKRLHNKAGNSVDSRKLANNTYLERRYKTFASWIDTRMPIQRTSAIAVRLHATDIVTFHRDGSISLDTGGWLTVTTKDRMNRYLPAPFSIFSDKGSWRVSLSWKTEVVHRDYEYNEIFVQHFCGDYLCYDRKEIATSVPYFDGIILDSSNASVVNAELIPQDRDHHNAVMRKAIKRYVDLYTNNEILDMITDERRMGDCWICLSETSGDKYNDDHLLTHMEEDYVMATLLLNALKASNYGDPWYIISYVPDMARRALSKYLRKRLLDGVMVTH